MTYTEDECKEIAWRAYMSRTDEEEFALIHRKSAKDEFEKWWNINKILKKHDNKRKN